MSGWAWLLQVSTHPAHTCRETNGVRFPSCRSSTSLSGRNCVNLDSDDRHFIARKSDLDDRLYKMYDKIEEVENGLMDARAKKQAIEADKITGDNIYKILICFDKLYATMTDAERRSLVKNNSTNNTKKRSTRR